MVLETKTNSLNSDLVWNLDKIKKRQLAIDFIKKFEGKFCVYSSSVEQFYTNYTMNFLSGESTKMVILPNPYAFHDTFNGINDDAIIETGLNIIPGETLKRQGLYLMISYKNQQRIKVLFTELSKEAFTSKWDELSEEKPYITSEELVLRNTFINA